MNSFASLPRGEVGQLRVRLERVGGAAGREKEGGSAVGAT